MITYSFIKYDVLKDIMYFKSTPTPDFKQLIKTGGISTEQDKEIIEGIQSTYNNLIPQSASVYIASYLETIPELDLSGSKDITLKIEIDDDTDEVGDVLIISQNTNQTITTINVPNNNWPTSIASKIKLPVKYPTLGKCENCLKFDFITGSNDYNFYGSLGGEWTGQYINGQKEYRFFLPDYSNALNYGATTEYRVHWRPNASYTGNDYNNNPISFSNQKRWVATPVSQINSPLNTSSFFHVTPGDSASCPYYNDTPLTPPWYNFLGEKGYFLTSLANQLPDKPCPTFSPIPGEVSWGWNCGPNGCVPSPSGSIGTYATLEECNVSCSIDPTGSVEYICTLNGCVQVPSGSGGYLTIEECEAKCSDPLEECDCTGNLVNILNPNFDLGPTNWNITPSTLTPGIGGWFFSGYAGASISNGFFNNVNTSSVSISQPNVLNISCSYQVCFKAWTTTPDSSSFISVDTGDYILNLPEITTALTTAPSVYSFTISNIQTTDLTFYAAGNGRIHIDDICVKQIYCPPPTEPTGSELCIITGSSYCYEDVIYDCTCPEGYISDGNGNCIGSGSLTLNSISGFGTSSSDPLYGIIPGWSLNQRPSGIIIYPEVANNLISTWLGLIQPILYYDWNFNGTGDSSTNNLSPFSGSSLVYNTQYTFDILSSSFWYQPDLQPLDWPSRWVTQLVRSTAQGNNNQQTWSGFGTTLDVPSPKTYYVGILGQGSMKIKLDGNTILRTGPSETSSVYYYQNNSNFNFPAYEQNMLSRNSEQLSSYGVLPPPYYGANPYLTNVPSINLNNTVLLGACNHNYFHQNGDGPECAPPLGTAFKYSAGFNLYIYPITMSAGCHKINFEVNVHTNDKYCQYSAQGYLGAIILDMTAEQIISASNYNDLNIAWDSTYLPALTSNNNLYGADFYAYRYPVNVIPPTSSYISFCPSGSTPIGGDPCNGCQTTQSINLTIPCGDCVECTHGLLYNGYVVDAGGPANAGRGIAGLVNTSSIDNPINTWKIPENNDWYDLITFINNSTPPSNATPTGSYGVDVGGKLKDYTRDLIATCWGFPNIGAQTDDFNSGWNGVAGGIRNDVGVFSELLLEGYWWTANSTLSSTPLKLAAINLKHTSNEIYREDLFKSNGCSIRLVRPAELGETSGDTILNAYVGNDGTIYDGIILGNQVWLTVNLSETKFNNNSTITIQPNANVWDDTLTTANKFACYYNNSSLNANLPKGNVNPLTGQCYEYPTWYVYRKCGGNELLIQTEPGATTTPGEVQKADDLSCWEFVEETQSNSGITYQLYITGNYFENNTTVYNGCEECTAIHTIYLNFGSKNC